MLGADFYGAAAFAIGACLLLIYVVVSWPRPTRARKGSPSRGPERAAPVARPRRVYRMPPERHRQRLDLNNVEQQLHAVIAAPFERRRLLSAAEYQAFKVIEDCLQSSRRGYRVFAQTSLGEILASPDENAFRSINSKRVDILIVDHGGWPVLAVEYQGGAHYQGTAAIRDAVKKEALNKAGIGYAEVFASDNAEEIRLLISTRLGWIPDPASARVASRA